MTVGDINGTERGTGARYNDNKPDYSLIPLWTLEDEAKVWAYGAKKYKEWNWARGMAWSVPFACAMRHLSAWQRGEELDRESGLPHLAHALCNLRMLTLFAVTYPEGDDRPPKEFMYRQLDVAELKKVLDSFDPLPGGFYEIHKKGESNE